MDIKTAFEVLARAHGSHSGAATAIGFTRDHYRALRNGRSNIPPRTSDYIILKAAEASGLTDLLPAPPTSALAQSQPQPQPQEHAAPQA